MAMHFWSVAGAIPLQIDRDVCGSMFDNESSPRRTEAFLVRRLPPSVKTRHIGENYVRDIVEILTYSGTV